MTTFVLQGGPSGNDKGENDALYKSFTSHVPKDNIKILMCYWAKERRDWQRKYDEERELVRKFSDASIEFHMVEDPKDLFEHLPDADVLYVAGGFTRFMLPYLPEMSRLRHGLEGKVYIGSSFGAFIAAEHYITSSSGSEGADVKAGLGMLPIQVLYHFDVDPAPQAKLHLLRERSTLPIVTLDQYQVVKIYR